MRIIVNEDFISRLNHNRIFTTWPSSPNCRWKIGDKIDIADNLSTEPYCAFLSGNSITSLGAFSYTGSALPAFVSAGRYCSLAHRIATFSTAHPLTRFTTSSLTYDTKFDIFTEPLTNSRNKSFKQVPAKPYKLPITIENDVWIGDDALLKPGIVIHSGAVVGARSIVTKDVPPYAVVAGGGRLSLNLDSRRTLLMSC